MHSAAVMPRYGASKSPRRSAPPFVFTVLIIGLFVSPQIFATGPDAMRVNVVPVSINEDMDVLVRFDYWFNPMGRSAVPDFHYGWGLIDQSGELEILDERLFEAGDGFVDGEGTEEYRELIMTLRVPRLEHVPPELLETVRARGFASTNAWQYERNRATPTESYRHQLRRALPEQRSLHGARSIGYGDVVHELYAIGRLRFFFNYAALPSPQQFVGARFDYNWDSPYVEGPQEYYLFSVVGWALIDG